MSTHTIARSDELDEGERLVVDIGGREIAVFHIDGEYHAVLNWCPHQSGPLCEGPLSGTVEAKFDRDRLETTQEWVREGRIVVCPWHAWEFELDSGACLGDRDISVPTYPVSVDDGEIRVTI